MTSSGEAISLGQKQLIAFMRAVLRDPEILILDEATANVDTVTEQLLEQILAKLPASTTKVIIAHRLNTIANADEIFFINAGDDHARRLDGPRARSAAARQARELNRSSRLAVTDGSGSLVSGCFYGTQIAVIWTGRGSCGSLQVHGTRISRITAWLPGRGFSRISCQLEQDRWVKHFRALGSAHAGESALSRPVAS